MEALLLDGLANLPLETHRPISDLERWLFGWLSRNPVVGQGPKRKRLTLKTSEDERLDQTIRV
jgi:hypothetical protein